MIRDFYDIDLSGRNSFHVRQRAARLVEFETTDDLTAFFRKGAPAKWTVLAGGNNILFTQDFDGVLLTPRAASIDVVAETPDAVAVRAEAGVEWDDLVAWAVERDLWGIENLSLIPGKVGAAPVQNIGAYGAEAKDAIESVEMFCTDTCNTLILSREHCAFGYRESVFKHALRGRVVITAVTFRLSPVRGPIWVTAICCARPRRAEAPRCATSAKQSVRSGARSCPTRPYWAMPAVSSRIRWWRPPSPNGFGRTTPPCRSTPPPKAA